MMMMRIYDTIGRIMHCTICNAYNGTNCITNCTTNCVTNSH